MRVTQADFSYRRRRERLKCGIGRVPAQDQIAGDVRLGVRFPDETDTALVGHRDEPSGGCRRKHVYWNEAVWHRRVALDRIGRGTANGPNDITALAVELDRI